MVIVGVFITTVRGALRVHNENAKAPGRIPAHAVSCEGTRGTRAAAVRRQWPCTFSANHPRRHASGGSPGVDACVCLRSRERTSSEARRWRPFVTQDVQPRCCKHSLLPLAVGEHFICVIYSKAVCGPFHFVQSSEVSHALPMGRFVSFVPQTPLSWPMSVLLPRLQHLLSLVTLSRSITLL